MKGGVMRIASGVLLLAGLVLTGCATEVSTAKRANPEDLGRNTVVTVTNPSLPLTGDRPLAWYQDVRLVADPSDSFSPQDRSSSSQDLAAQIQQKLQQGIEAKGLAFVPAVEQARYQVVAYAVMGSAATAAPLEDLFKLYPDLDLNDGKHQRGTLLVAIVDPHTRKAAWRSALQGVLDREQPEEVRQLRLDRAIERLLASLQVTPAR